MKLSVQRGSARVEGSTSSIDGGRDICRSAGT